MTKVVKVGLCCKVVDKDGNSPEYKDVCRCLWDLQRETRDLKNKFVREAWEWYGFSNDYYKLNNEYPVERDYLIRENPDGIKKNYKLDGFIYDKYKSESDLNTGNFSASIKDVVGRYKNNLRAILRGDMSVMSYGADQPIDVAGKSIALKYDKESDAFSFTLSLLNKEGSKKYNISNFDFGALVKDNSTRCILERCFDNMYKISTSKLIWNKKKKMWFLHLAYSFKGKAVDDLDKNRILGVNLGVYYPVYASVYGEKAKYYVIGEPILKFRDEVEARRTTLKKQAAICGDGRIGHGYKTRMKPVLKISDRIARFRDTFNHAVSRKVIKDAIKEKCGVIQLEDLTGITTNAEPFLKNWSYYDLQSKIKYKAKEAGIKVVVINPAYTSQRCSKCGYIHADNHPVRERFICGRCGFETLHDFNASQNIGIKDIDKIIAADRKKPEMVEKSVES